MGAGVGVVLFVSVGKVGAESEREGNERGRVLVCLSRGQDKQTLRTGL